MGGHGAIEVAKTVIEVADMAWTAVECRHHHHQHNNPEDGHAKCPPSEKEELESLRSENRRLRNSLEQNLKLLQNLTESPCLLKDCPPDLYTRLVATVDSENFLNQIKSLHEASANGISYEFPFRESKDRDVHSGEIMVNVNHEDPSWWVWVTEEMVPNKVEERSGIDNENYIILNEEHVVDGITNFMARCILANPNAQKLTPEELQKTIANALHGESKLEKMVNIWHAGSLFYSLSTWGLALAGLYKTRAVLKLAAVGAHTTSKIVLRALLDKTRAVLKLTAVGAYTTSKIVLRAL